MHFGYVILDLGFVISLCCTYAVTFTHLILLRLELGSVMEVHRKIGGTRLVSLSLSQTPRSTDKSAKVMKEGEKLNFEEKKKSRN